MMAIKDNNPSYARKNLSTDIHFGLHQADYCIILSTMLSISVSNCRAPQKLFKIATLCDHLWSLTPLGAWISF